LIRLIPSFAHAQQSSFPSYLRDLEELGYCVAIEVSESIKCLKIWSLFYVYN
jgi:hypothetical protein